jgi:RNase adaptor protein for sRNA GlmZ degradation
MANNAAIDLFSGARRPLERVVTKSGASAEVDGERISLHTADGVLIARYDAERRELTLTSPGDVALVAKRRMTLEAETLAVKAGRAELEIGHWQLTAARIVEKTGDLFRSIEGIAETRARRMRTLVERTLELMGGRTSIISKEDTRIDGKRVLLG